VEVFFFGKSADFLFRVVGKGTMGREGGKEERREEGKGTMRREGGKERRSEGGKEGSKEGVGGKVVGRKRRGGTKKRREVIEDGRG
jgi:hypothetical protein